MKPHSGAEKAFGSSDARLAPYLYHYGFALVQVGKYDVSIPALKRVETIYHEAFRADDWRTKEARLDCLTIRNESGEQLTPEEEEEGFLLFGEVMSKGAAETQAKEAEEK